MVGWILLAPAILALCFAFYVILALREDHDAAVRQARRLCEIVDYHRAERVRLLSLDVDLRAERAMSQVSPEGAAAYLASCGWTRGAGRRFAQWRNGEAHVLVPMEYTTDYAMRIRELVRRLAEREGRSQLGGAAHAARSPIAAFSTGESAAPFCGGIVGR